MANQQPVPRISDEEAQRINASTFQFGDANGNTATELYGDVVANTLCDNFASHCRMQHEISIGGNNHDIPVSELLGYSIMKNLSLTQRVERYFEQCNQQHQAGNINLKESPITAMPWNQVPVVRGEGGAQSIYIGTIGGLETDEITSTRKWTKVQIPRQNLKGDKQLYVFHPNEVVYKTQLKSIFKSASNDIRKVSTSDDYIDALELKLREDSFQEKLAEVSTLPIISDTVMNRVFWHLILNKARCIDCGAESSCHIKCTCLNGECHEIVNNTSQSIGFEFIHLDCANIFLDMKTTSTCGTSWHVQTVTNPDAGETTSKSKSGLVYLTKHNHMPNHKARLFPLLRESEFRDEILKGSKDKTDTIKEREKRFFSKMMKNKALRDQYINRRRAVLFAKRSQDLAEDSVQPGLPTWMIQCGIEWSEGIMNSAIAAKGDYAILFYFCDVSISDDGTKILRNENTRSIWHKQGFPLIRTGSSGKGREIERREIAGLDDDIDGVLVWAETHLYHTVGGRQSEGLERILTANALGKSAFSGLVANYKCGGPPGVKGNSAIALMIFYVGEGMEERTLALHKKSKRSQRRRIKNGFKKHGWEDQFVQVVKGSNHVYTDISDEENGDNYDDDEEEGGYDAEDVEQKQLIDSVEEEVDEEDYVER